MRAVVLDILRRYLHGPFRQAGGANVITRCPFHKGGQERKPSFSVHLDEGVYNCFTGGCPGGSGDLTKMLRLLGATDGQIEAETAIIGPELKRNREAALLRRKSTFENKDPTRAPFPLPESLLGVYDWMPPGLTENGFDAQLLRTMEIGYDPNTSRITYPLRDMHGTLAGISGGSVIGEEPKYKVYQGGRKLESGRWQVSDFGQWFDEQFAGYTCENREFLWNYHRVYGGLMSAPDATVRLHVVEGFKACLWMIQSGFPNTVALMGSSMSETQLSLLCRLGVTVVLFLDNDEAGRKGTGKIARRLVRPMGGRALVMPYPVQDWGTQPDSYTPFELHKLNEAAVRAV